MSKAPNTGKADIGHNMVQKDQLQNVIERIERLNEEMDALKADVKAVYAEAKGKGLNPKIVRQIIKDRKLEPHVFREWPDELWAYRDALGLGGTPLGDVAERAAKARLN